MIVHHRHQIEMVGEGRVVPGVEESGSASLSTSGLLPPPFDMREMGQYVRAPVSVIERELTIISL